SDINQSYFLATTPQKIMKMAEKWFCLPNSSSLELQLETVLSGGQSFRWSKTSPSVWTGVFGSKLWHLKREDSSSSSSSSSSSNNNNNSSNNNNNNNVMYQASSGNQRECEQELRNYFQLDISVKDLYKQWRQADPVFEQMVGTKLQGIRVLRQDPVENLFSFICSSNNNIDRITSMVDKLCCHYGTEISSFDGKTYYTFPTVEALSQPGVEEKLRELGFGYRAGYITKSAKYISGLENGVG
ncbi:N-glycosylase/DNA lyase-like, partial [Argonauta hians]